MLTRETLTTSTTSIGVVLEILAIAYRWLVKRNERVPPGSNHRQFTQLSEAGVGRNIP